MHGGGVHEYQSEEFVELEPKALIEATLAASPALATWGDWAAGRPQGACSDICGVA